VSAEAFAKASRIEGKNSKANGKSKKACRIVFFLTSVCKNSKILIIIKNSSCKQVYFRE
jgi:hypothetical protein